MSFFDEMVAPPIEILVAGRRVRLGILTLSDHARAARRMRESMVPIDEVLRQLQNVPPDKQDALLETAYRDARFGGHVELEDVLRWYRTPEGYQYRLWLAAVKHQPEITLDDIEVMMTLLDSEENDLPLDGMPEGNRTSPPMMAGSGSKDGGMAYRGG